MYESREEVDEVQFGNLDAAVDQLIFARSKEQDKMKRDPESRRRSGHHSEDQRLPEVTEPPRDQGGNSIDFLGFWANVWEHFWGKFWAVICTGNIGDEEVIHSSISKILFGQ